ncbi:MAG: ribbon-helix-helix domain-containing protein [Candidatus Eremiobacterota bacterium]
MSPIDTQIPDGQAGFLFTFQPPACMEQVVPEQISVEIDERIVAQLDAAAAMWEISREEAASRAIRLFLEGPYQVEAGLLDPPDGRRTLSVLLLRRRSDHAGHQHEHKPAPSPRVSPPRILVRSSNLWSLDERCIMHTTA